MLLFTQYTHTLGVLSHYHPQYLRHIIGEYAKLYNKYQTLPGTLPGTLLAQNFSVVVGTNVGVGAKVGLNVGDKVGDNVGAKEGARVPLADLPLLLPLPDLPDA